MVKKSSIDVDDFEKTISDIEDLVEKTKVELEDRIKKRPLECAGFILMTGIILGLLFARRN